MRNSRNLTSAIAFLVCSIAVYFLFTLSVGLENIDFIHYLDKWVTSLDTIGLAGTLGNQVANYTAPYMVLLDVVNKTIPDAEPLTVMHTTGLVLHVFLACVVFYLSRALGPDNPQWQSVVFAMLIPTSIANGPIWGQSDAFFSAFVLLSFYASLTTRWTLAFILFSAALSIKLLAIFASPALLILLYRAGQISKAIWFPPILLLTYLTLNLPYISAGVPISDVLGIYLQQSGTYDQLSMWAPNFWYIGVYLPLTQGLFDRWSNELVLFGLIGSALFGALIVFFAAQRGKGPLRSIDALWLLSTCALVFPSLLPKMHDRYFFLGDVSLWLLASIDRRFLLPAILAQTASLMAYSGVLNYFNEYIPWPLHYTISLAAIMMILAIFSSFFVAKKNGIIQRLVGIERAEI